MALTLAAASGVARAQEFDLATGICLSLGQDPNPQICAVVAPELKDKVSQARDNWRKRNVGQLWELQTACETRLDIAFNGDAGRIEAAKAASSSRMADFIAAFVADPTKFNQVDCQAYVHEFGEPGEKVDDLSDAIDLVRLQPVPEGLGNNPQGTGPPAQSGGDASTKTNDADRELAETRIRAEQGDPEAQCEIGEFYFSGRRGLPVDRARGMAWLRRAAEQGSARGQMSLGTFYSGSYGDPPDYPEAVRWIRKAAEQGHGDGQFGLAVAYADGIGVPRDPVQALMWIELAGAAGVTGAGSFRDRIVLEMNPAQIAEGQALARAWKPVLPDAE